MRWKRIRKSRSPEFSRHMTPELKLADLIREHGIFDRSFYHWTSIFGCLDASEAGRQAQEAPGRGRTEQRHAPGSAGKTPSLYGARNLISSVLYDFVAYWFK